MTVLEQISNPYLASLVLGQLYGLTFCASACLPYIVRYIAGIRAGLKKGITITSIYNSGRIVAYAVMGTTVGLLSTIISEEYFSAYQQYSSFAFGVIIIFIGTTIIMKKSDNCVCKEQKPDRFGISKLTSRFDLRGFFMGFTRGLILCPPLVVLLLYSVTFAPVYTTILALLFGLGTALISAYTSRRCNRLAPKQSTTIHKFALKNWRNSSGCHGIKRLGWLITRHHINGKKRKMQKTISNDLIFFRYIDMYPYNNCLNVAGKPIYESKNWLK